VQRDDRPHRRRRVDADFLFWKALFDHGVFTNPVIPPAVPEGSSRIRTSVMASHTDAQVDAALEKIQRAGKQSG